jgi:three-Cys-motif partner protein
VTLKFDKIGYWSEVKLEIVKEYAAAYSRILARQPRLRHVYIDAFAGSGVHLRRSTGEPVAGSPLNALRIEPAFHAYFLIDLKAEKVAHLKREIGDRSNVFILSGDANDLLLREVFPKVRFEDYRRGLCLLDPYGLHLDWRVISEAGRLGSIDLFLNFPVMDINRNALWKNPAGVDPEDLRRMSRFWGDDSWRRVAYRPSRQPGLFGEETEKATNEEVAGAFGHRLRNVAGFKHVPTPMPMKNKNGADVYYLFFASQNPVAAKIAGAIFRKYSKKGVR